MDNLCDDRYRTAAEKRRILAGWEAFFLAGFRWSEFSPALYRFLISACGFSAHFDRARFWAAFFDDDLLSLRAFCNQFGGDRCSVEFGGTGWLGGESADLKAAMCRSFEPVYRALVPVLDDLDRQQDELSLTWSRLAHQAGLGRAYPPGYRVTEHTRRLLGYVAGLAWRQDRLARQGIQQRFPTGWLEPVPIAS